MAAQTMTWGMLGGRPGRAGSTLAGLSTLQRRRTSGGRCARLHCWGRPLIAALLGAPAHRARNPCMRVRARHQPAACAPMEGHDCHPRQGPRTRRHAPGRLERDGGTARCAGAPAGLPWLIATLAATLRCLDEGCGTPARRTGTRRSPGARTASDRCLARPTTCMLPSARWRQAGAGTREPARPDTSPPARTGQAVHRCRDTSPPWECLQAGKKVRQSPQAAGRPERGLEQRQQGWRGGQCVLDGNKRTWTGRRGGGWRGLGGSCPVTALARAGVACRAEPSRASRRCRHGTAWCGLSVCALGKWQLIYSTPARRTHVLTALARSEPPPPRPAGRPADCLDAGAASHAPMPQASPGAASM